MATKTYTADNATTFWQKNPLKLSDGTYTKDYNWVVAWQKILSTGRIDTASDIFAVYGIS